MIVMRWEGELVPRCYKKLLEVQRYWIYLRPHKGPHSIMTGRINFLNLSLFLATSIASHFTFLLV